MAGELTSMRRAAIFWMERLASGLCSSMMCDTVAGSPRDRQAIASADISAGRSCTARSTDRSEILSTPLNTHNIHRYAEQPLKRLAGALMVDGIPKLGAGLTTRHSGLPSSELRWQWFSSTSMASTSLAEGFRNVLERTFPTRRDSMSWSSTTCINKFLLNRMLQERRTGDENLQYYQL